MKNLCSLRRILSGKHTQQRPLGRILFGILALGAAICLASCNVVRTITNESQYYQKGDTSVVIQTKTIEQYDASKK